MSELSRLPFREVLARSSIGAAAWCSTCHQPDLICECETFQPMTVEEWLAWKGPR